MAKFVSFGFFIIYTILYVGYHTVLFGYSPVVHVVVNPIVYVDVDAVAGLPDSQRELVAVASDKSEALFHAVRLAAEGYGNEVAACGDALGDNQCLELVTLRAEERYAAGARCRGDRPVGQVDGSLAACIVQLHLHVGGGKVVIGEAAACHQLHYGTTEQVGEGDVHCLFRRIGLARLSPHEVAGFVVGFQALVGFHFNRIG